MRIPLLCLGFAVLPLPLLAQRGPVALATGFGFTQSGDLTGGGFHAQLSVPLADIGPGLSLRAEALAQQGTITGPPSTCEHVAELRCLGRSDRNRIVGGGGHLRVELAPPGGTLRPYLALVGVGIYHRRTESTETQGPTGICMVDGQAVSCPDNPPLQSFSAEDSDTALGWSTGAGVEASVAGMRVFAEARLHRLLDGGGAGALPLSIGVSF